MDEHRIIEQVLNCLSKMILKFEAEGKVEEAPSRQVVDFLRNFADKFHHGKEEAHLFPMFEEQNAGGHCGPIPVMLNEHDQGRAYVRGMDESIEAASEGDKIGMNRWGNHAKGFIMLLRSHIEKEDQILYTMANETFSQDDQRELLAKFAKADNEEMEPGTREKYVGIANELAEKFGVTRVVQAEPAQG